MFTGQCRYEHFFKPSFLAGCDASNDFNVPSFDRELVLDASIVLSCVLNITLDIT